MNDGYEIGDNFIVGTDSAQTKYEFAVLYRIPEMLLPVHEVDLQFVATGWPPKTFYFAFYDNFRKYVLGRQSNFINKYMFNPKLDIWYD